MLVLLFFWSSSPPSHLICPSLALSLYRHIALLIIPLVSSPPTHTTCHPPGLRRISLPSALFSCFLLMDVPIRFTAPHPRYLVIPLGHIFPPYTMYTCRACTRPLFRLAPFRTSRYLAFFWSLPYRPTITITTTDVSAPCNLFIPPLHLHPLTISRPLAPAITLCTTFLYIWKRNRIYSVVLCNKLTGIQCPSLSSSCYFEGTMTRKVGSSRVRSLWVDPLDPAAKREEGQGGDDYISESPCKKNKEFRLYKYTSDRRRKKSMRVTSERRRGRNQCDIQD